jgi:predicted MPP superfamily phosphohydrolase
LGLLGFVAAAAIVTGLIHFYLWRRLVRDTSRPGWWRRAGGLAMLALALLVPATMLLGRANRTWLAWPGYLWLAVMFYLLVVLLPLEVPMLVARVVWRARGARTVAAARGVEPARVAANAGDRAPIAELSGGPPRHTSATSTQSGFRSTSDRPTSTKLAGPAGDGRAGGAQAGEARAGGAQTGEARAGGDHAATDPGRRLLLARGAAIFAGLTAAGVTGSGVRSALGPPTVDRVQIPLAKLDGRLDGFRIALVADIHLGPLAGRAHTERVVATINRLDADLVAVVGDLVDGSVAELGAAAAPLRDLRSRHGSFFVTGNHEYYSGVEQWVAEVRRLGLRPLQNERLEISDRGGAFDLAGVNDPTGAQLGFAQGPDFDRALGGRDAGRPVVLLAHQPVHVRQAARHGVDLQLSGHTHGGQMVPFNLLVALQQPVVSGYGEVDGTKLYVTNGAGFWGPPVRVGAPPQVTLVQLRAS